MQPVAELLSRIKLGNPLQFQNLTLFPLLALNKNAPGYLLLDEALERKVAHVTEVSESGSVPELLFVNDGEEKVLLVDGEELVGARQNRILNMTLLVGGMRKVVIPVSCVEQGRWAYKSRHFASADRALFSRARAKKAQQVNASLRASGSRYANQAEIWSDISAKAAFLRVDSSTEAMGDIYESQSASIDHYVMAFKPLPGQAGAVFAINGRVTGAELFDSDATFRKFMAKLLRSYAMDAIESPQSDAKPAVEESVYRFLEDIKTASVQRFPALAEGEDIRIESDTVAGGALFAEDRVVHLCAFHIEEKLGGPIGRGGGIDFEVPAFLRRSRRAV
jgi:hypothetical protein